MGEYIRQQADKHKVKHTHSGKLHFFEVTSGNSGNEHTVSIKINCGCDFTGKQGQAKGTMCSHVLAVLREVINRGDIRITHDESTLEKRNACKQLVRPSSRNLNQIRYGKNEGTLHQQKKWNICMDLDRQKKHYYTEAIIDEAGLRSDIICLDNFTVIEVVDSESDASLEIKRKKYESIGLTMEVVRV